MRTAEVAAMRGAGARLAGASETERPGPRRAASWRVGWARGEARGGLAKRDRTRGTRARRLRLGPGEVQRPVVGAAPGTASPEAS